jgi:concanavalin A-like lectin/glucanase superfamily protein
MMRTAFFVFALLAIMAYTALGEIDPNNIAGLWLFDEQAGVTALDSSANGNDGEIHGAQRVAGKYGKALEFSGDSFVSIRDAKNLRLSEQFTMQVWFLAEEIDSWRQLIAKDNEYLLRIDPPAEGNKMSAFINLGGWEPRASASVPELDTWIHFAATYDGDQLRVYINGVAAGEIVRVGNIKGTSNPLEFGRWGEGLIGDDVGYFEGIIDEVAIFNEALTEDDILEAMDGLERFRAPVEAAGKLATTWGNIKFAFSVAG